MLYYLSLKLSSSSISKELISFFIYTSTDHGFPPSDFLTNAEMSRLDFSDRYGCIINMSGEQLRMVIGMGVGIKIFTFYVLYQPWNISYAGEIIRKGRNKIK